MRLPSSLGLILLQVLLVTPMGAAISLGAMHQSKADGVLVGSVSRGPVTPHGPVGGIWGGPVAAALIDIATDDNKAITSVVSDSLGNFRVALPPGEYRVTMATVRGARPRNMPANITIRAGSETRLNIFLDTGLR
jgi:Carboxypeptidase regulatory-like domain